MSSRPKANARRPAQGRGKGRKAAAVSGTPGAACAPAVLAPTATGLLIPRIHKAVPVEFTSGKEQHMLQLMMDAKLLKPTSRAADAEEFARMALWNIPGLKKFEDMGSIRIDDDDPRGGRPAGIYFGVDLWSVDGYGGRIELAEVIGGIQHVELIKWMINVINCHPLLAGPDRWDRLCASYSEGIEGLEGTPAGDSLPKVGDPEVPAYDEKEYEVDWLNDCSKPAAHHTAAMLAVLKDYDPDLGAIFDELVHFEGLPTTLTGDKMYMCVNFKDRGLVDQCWDADMENDNGDMAFSFGGDLDFFIKGFATIDKAVAPLHKLLSWKSKSTCLATLSELRSLFTKEDPRQLRFALGIQSPKA